VVDVKINPSSQIKIIHISYLLIVFLTIILSIIISDSYTITFSAPIPFGAVLISWLAFVEIIVICRNIKKREMVKKC